MPRLRHVARMQDHAIRRHFHQQHYVTTRVGCIHRMWVAACRLDDPDQNFYENYACGASARAGPHFRPGRSLDLERPAAPGRGSLLTLHRREKDSNHRSLSREKPRLSGGFDFAREVRGRLFAEGHRIRTIGPAPAKGGSARCQSETAARKAEPLTDSGPRRECLPGVAPPLH
jgi:hypothetical protein